MANQALFFRIEPNYHSFFIKKKRKNRNFYSVFKQQKAPIIRIIRVAKYESESESESSKVKEMKNIVVCMNTFAAFKLSEIT